MARRYKPALPNNIQNFIKANELYAQNAEQMRLDRARQNETIFRESHNAIIHNAEVRRNARRGMEEARLARLDMIIDRRQKLARLLVEEKEQWQEELLARGYTIYRP